LAGPNRLPETSRLGSDTWHTHRGQPTNATGTIDELHGSFTIE
jgi:hypothetical protein